MTEIHQLRIALRHPTFVKLLQLREATGATFLVEVIRRAIDDYALCVLPVQSQGMENDGKDAE